MNTPVSFEIAKLLEEKGFNEEVLFYYSDSVLKQHPLNKLYNWNLDNPPLNQFSAPTIAEIVMWLYEKHDVWINVEASRLLKFNYRISKKEATKLLTVPFTFEVINAGYDYKSPTETYEAAIEYTLNNLI